MKIFISWSGTLSKKVAVALKEWIPNVLQFTEPYVSSEDIDKGSRWSIDIAKELVDSSFGILCVTKDNYKAPWLNFEAGALSKKMDSSRVCPFLFNVKRSEIDGPLLQFQVTNYHKDDVLKLMTTINNSCIEQNLTEERLNKTFNLWWPNLEESLKIEISGEEQDEETNNSYNTINGQVLEEMLALIQTQQKILRRPEELLPPDYFFELMDKYAKKDPKNISKDEVIELINRYEKIRFAATEHLKILQNMDKNSEENNDKLIKSAKRLSDTCKTFENDIIRTLHHYVANNYISYFNIESGKKVCQICGKPVQVFCKEKDGN